MLVVSLAAVVAADVVAVAADVVASVAAAVAALVTFETRELIFERNRAAAC